MVYQILPVILVGLWALEDLELLCHPIRKKKVKEIQVI